MTHQSGSPMWTVVSRDAELHLTAATFGSAAPVSATYSYSPLTGHQTGLTMAPSGSTTYLAHIAYGWDPLGNLVSRNDMVNSLQEAYCYDGLNRLITVELTPTCAAGTTVELSLTYDLLGNLTGKSDIGTYTYPAAGGAQPHGVQSIAPAGGGTALSFVYDSVGKMATDALTQNGFTYLPYRLPLTVAHTGGDTITMQYDADHNRVARTITGGSTTFYLPDGEAVLRPGAAIRYTTYFMGDGQRVGQDTGGSGRTHRYFLNDFQNSIGLVTDDTAAVLQNLAFDPFGKPRNPNGTPDPSWGTSAVTPRGYINQEMLRDVQLIDLNARYFDPALARFLVPDPVIADMDDGQAWNAYAYANNDPLNLIDALGLDSYSFYAATKSVFLGPVNSGFSHTSVIIVDVGDMGTTYTDLAAGPSNSFGKLGTLFGLSTLTPAYTGDRLADDLSGQLSSNQLTPIQVPPGQTPEDFAANLTAAADTYQGGDEYDAMGGGGFLGYNSNSFAAGVIGAAGGIPPSLSATVPGYFTPLPMAKQNCK